MILLVGYSLLQENNPLLATRSALILLLVLSAYTWKVNSRFFLKSLFYVSLSLVLGLVIIETYMFTVSEEEYSYIRNVLIKENGIGDIFLFHDIYYKLELRGTPLIAFVYMLSYIVELFPQRYSWLYRLIYLVGVILAGNFAYQLAVLFFHLALYLYHAFDNPVRLTKRVFNLSIIFFLFGSALFPYISDTFKDKQTGGSLPTRYDQIEVLFEDVSQTEISLLMGSGLGHTIEKKTNVRDYRGGVYYELQTLYIFNQLGMLGFSLLIVTNIFLAFRYLKNKDIIIVYACYVLYACTNPYIWDTTQIVVIVSLLSTREIISGRRCPQNITHL